MSHSFTVVTPSSSLSLYPPWIPRSPTSSSLCKHLPQLDYTQLSMYPNSWTLLKENTQMGWQVSTQIHDHKSTVGTQHCLAILSLPVLTVSSYTVGPHRKPSPSLPKPLVLPHDLISLETEKHCWHSLIFLRPESYSLPSLLPDPRPSHCLWFTLPSLSLLHHQPPFFTYLIN